MAPSGGQICNLCKWRHLTLHWKQGYRGQFHILHWILLLFCFSDEIKVRIQYFKEVSIHLMSDVWLKGHFPQKSFVIWWKLAFLTQKTWFHAISRLFSFSTNLICKNCTKYNFLAKAKFRRNRFSYSNTPKYAQNWLFLAIFPFFLFLRSIFWKVRT